MELTGKCKEEFEKWVFTKDANTYLRFIGLRDFYNLPNAMRYGVLVDYFDSVGIQIGIEFFDNSRATGFDYQILTENDRDFDDENCMDAAKVYSGNDHIGLRPEARTEAIEKADELQNKVLN
jgi:hypothetical protein|tara:strand:- start:140 stop:505 length:366 start_codon:yes stop_codon:yes gene_type:complete